MTNNTTLWKTLEKNDIVIPIIQRDYAQGRKDKGYIRKNFLSEIKKHLDDDSYLTLDFIYGNYEGRKFCPIDGQQRLTTLWLLHWYLALKTNMLDNIEIRDRLKKFTYETRESSKLFCEKLCEIDCEAKDKNELLEYIKEQTWFYSEWLQDPTINAMLRTISGEDGSKDDNIEHIFVDNYLEYWQKLTDSEPGIISFELLEIGTENLPVSDDLYIKMNARGKALTNFENLKADLVGWIDKNLTKEAAENYTKKLDGEWTDFFWKESKENFEKLNVKFNGKIDVIYYSLFNRFVFNKIIHYGHIEKSIIPDSFLTDNHKDPEDWQKPIFKSFDKIYGKNGDDSNILYESFEIYKDYISDKALSDFDVIIKVYDQNKESINYELNTFTNEDEEDVSKQSYNFIPKFVNNEKKGLFLNSTTQKERIYFYAVCCFIEKSTFTNNDYRFDSEIKKKFKRWMRVCRNIIENSDIRAIPAMITCIGKIDELIEKTANSKHNLDIYSYLSDCSDMNIKKNDSKLNIQLNEEIQKAKAITDATIQITEDEIKEAESIAFFKGAISFLFRDSDDNLDWVAFKTKAGNAKNKLFDSSNEVKFETVKLFMEQFEDFHGDFYLSTKGYSRKREEHCWKTYILCDSDKKFSTQLEGMLMEQSASNHNEIYEAFLNSNILKKICQESESYKYHYQEVLGEYAIHKAYGPKNEHYIFVTKNRLIKYEILSEFAKISADNQLEVVINKDKAWTFIRGKDIYFEFDNKDFDLKIKWNENEKKNADYICLVNDDSRGIFWTDENKDELILKLKNI